MPTLLLDRNAVKSMMRMGDVIDVVEEAFKMCGEGKGKMPAKVYLSLEQGDFRAMPAALPGCAGLKWVEMGAALVINPEQPADNLRTPLLRLLNEPSFRDNARAFAAKYAGFDQGPVLTNLVRRIEDTLHAERSRPMIGRLTGTLVEKTPPQITLDVQGVGYELDVPMSTFSNLPAAGERVSPFTHLVVREDAHILFGFLTEGERTMVRQLLKISGIGARTALAILSGLSVSELAMRDRLCSNNSWVLLPLLIEVGIRRGGPAVEIRCFRR